MAEDEEGFDWEGELWETLTHELQHHLESLADEDALGAMDYAVDESFKREQGEPFDPWYFQWGESVGEGVYRTEGGVYIERTLTAEEFESLEEIEFTWDDQLYRIPRPRGLVDIQCVLVAAAASSVTVVLVRLAAGRQRLRRALRSERLTVRESSAKARRGAPPVL